jgi:hypothetical protein
VGFIFVSPNGSSPAGGPGRTTVSGKQLVRGAGSSEPSTPDIAPDRDPNRGPAGQPTFAISGRVAGFYPGASIPLVLTFTNPNSYAISVTSLEVSVRPAGSGCGPANLQVGPFHGPVVVAAEDSVTAEISMHMLENPDNACQGAVFPLDYRGAAVPA